MLIPVFNPEITDYEKSYLADDYTVGVTTVNVKNNERFAANDRIMIGEMGQEKTEIVTVSAVDSSNDTGLTIGATQFPHSADEPVIVLQFDQVKYYRSTTGSSGTYNSLATVALDVDNDTLQTVYDDTAGLSTYYYKVSFYHSIDAVESALSDPIPGGGWLRDQVGHIIDEVLQELSDLQEQHVTRGEVIGYFNDVNDDLVIDRAKPYEFLHSRTTLTRTANRNYIDFPADSNGRQTMWKFDRMDYNFTDTTTDPDTDNTSTITTIGMDEFRNRYPDNTISAATTSDAKPAHMTLDTSVKRFRFSHPAATTASNVFYLHFWKFFDVIDSEGDQIETPTPKIYKLYIKGMYYRKRAVTEPSYNAVADRYFADYLVEKNKYKSVDRLDAGTPRGFRPRSTVYKGYRR